MTDVTLDPSSPFEAALISMVETYRKKRADYAQDESPFSNFSDTARFAGFEADWLSALFNCSQKLSRISALRVNGRLDDPQNEAVEDTLLDNAVYGVIALAIFKETGQTVTVGGETVGGEASVDVVVNTSDGPEHFDENGHRRQCWMKNLPGTVQCTLKAGHSAKHSFEYGDHAPVRPITS